MQRGVRMVRRPWASTLGGIQGASFGIKMQVNDWEKKRKMLLPGHDAALGGIQGTNSRES